MVYSLPTIKCLGNNEGRLSSFSRLTPVYERVAVNRYGQERKASEEAYKHLLRSIRVRAVRASL